MKYIILISLFLLSACGEKEPDESSCHHNCNKIKPTNQKPADNDDTETKIKSTDDDLSSPADKNSSPSPIHLSVKGTTEKGQSCAVTLPKNATNLSHFQVSVQIARKHGNVTVQSLLNIKVSKDIAKPHIYYSSKTTPSISLEFQSEKIVYFSLWEQTKKKYSCTFK